MRSKAYRRAMRDKKDRRLRNIIANCGYIPHAGYIDWELVDGVWKQVGKYIKYPKNSNMQRYLKRQSNRKVRRAEISQKGNGYRKCSEYWWIIY